MREVYRHWRESAEYIAVVAFSFLLGALLADWGFALIVAALVALWGISVLWKDVWAEDRNDGDA